MLKNPTPNLLNGDSIRQALLTRAAAYCESANTSFSAIGKEAVNDTKFLARVRDGKGFNIDTYHKVATWLSEAEQRLEPAE